MPLGGPSAAVQERKRKGGKVNECIIKVVRERGQMDVSNGHELRVQPRGTRAGQRRQARGDCGRTVMSAPVRENSEKGTA